MGWITNNIYDKFIFLIMRIHYLKTSGFKSIYNSISLKTYLKEFLIVIFRFGTLNTSNYSIVRMERVLNKYKLLGYTF